VPTFRACPNADCNCTERRFVRLCSESHHYCTVCGVGWHGEFCPICDSRGQSNRGGVVGTIVSGRGEPDEVSDDESEVDESDDDEDEDDDSEDSGEDWSGGSSWSEESEFQKRWGGLLTIASFPLGALVGWLAFQLLPWFGYDQSSGMALLCVGLSMGAIVPINSLLSSWEPKWYTPPKPSRHYLDANTRFYLFIAVGVLLMMLASSAFGPGAGSIVLVLFAVWFFFGPLD